MNDKIINTSIEILGKFYSIRCPESELKPLQQAALFLNKKMSEVLESGKAINLERIAIITALNITHEFLQQDQKKEGVVGYISSRIEQLQAALDKALNKTVESELSYTTE